MKKEQIIQAMGCIDHDLIEGADNTRTKTRMRPAVRAGLIAACLCAALVGTVFAVEAVTGVSILRYFSGEEFDEVMQRADPNYQPSGEVYQGFLRIKEGMGVSLNNVSAEALSLAAGEGGKDFASFEEAEKFLGIDIYDNAVMDALRDEAYVGPELYEDGCLESVQLDRDSGAYLLCCADGDGMTWVQTTHYVTTGDLELNAVIVAELEAERFVNSTSESVVIYPAENALTEESYITVWGTEVPIVCNVSPASETSAGYTEYSAHFSAEGVRYWVAVGGESTVEGGAELLKEILNAFEF